MNMLKCKALSLAASLLPTINTVAASKSNRHLRPLNEMNTNYRHATLKYSILQAKIFDGHKDYMEPNNRKIFNHLLIQGNCTSHGENWNHE